MNRNETLQVLAYLKVAYPQAFNKLSKEDIQALTKMWELQFKDFNFDVVMIAVNSYISTDTSGFYPTIGKLKDMIYKLSNPSEMTEQEAWNLVKKAISRSGWYAQEEFDKLPPTLKKLVGSPNQLHDWALSDSDDINTVVASNFMRSYRARTTQEKEMALLPSQVKENLSQLTNEFIKRIEG